MHMFLPWEVVESPPPEEFKRRVDEAPRELLLDLLGLLLDLGYG